MNKEEQRWRLSRSLARHWFEDFLVGTWNYVRYFGGDHAELCRIGLSPNGIPPKYSRDVNLRFVYDVSKPMREEIDNRASRLGMSRDDVILTLLSVCELPFDPPELDRSKGF